MTEDYGPIEDASNDPSVVKRLMDPESMSVKQRGFFQGYAIPNPDNINSYLYKYQKYGSYEAAIGSMAELLEHFNMNPFHSLEILEHLLSCKWDADKDELEIWETTSGRAVLFISNHIPNDTDEVSFIMVGDHTNCTDSYCVNKD